MAATRPPRSAMDGCDDSTRPDSQRSGSGLRADCMTIQRSESSRVGSARIVCGAAIRSSCASAHPAPSSALTCHSLAEMTANAQRIQSDPISRRGRMVAPSAMLLQRAAPPLICTCRAVICCVAARRPDSACRDPRTTAWRREEGEAQREAEGSREATRNQSAGGSSWPLDRTISCTLHSDLEHAILHCLRPVT